MDQLFPSELLGQSGAVNTKETLAGKHVLIYFSAHWCPPCRGFTPVLAEFYNKHAKAKNFEVVFVSSDKDEEEFKEYFASHPWLALPFPDRPAKKALSSKFKVSGIPSLVLVDADGNTITTDARDDVGNDPNCEHFPWHPPTLPEMLGDTFIDPKGSKVDMTQLKGKHIGLYFSAHWCPPCRGFTPRLAETYTAAQAAGKPFEIIFVSSDRDEASFKEYHGSMPWLALPFEKRAEKGQLSKHFGVDGIPSLVILDPELKVVNDDARGAVGGDTKALNFPWTPPLVASVEDGAGKLNSDPCVVVLMEEAASHWDGVTAVLTKVAKEQKATVEGGAKLEGGEVAFMTAMESGGISDQIRKLFKVGKAGDDPHLVLVNLADGGRFYHPAKPSVVTEESVKTLIDDFRSGKLKYLSLEE